MLCTFVCLFVCVCVCVYVFFFLYATNINILMILLVLGGCHRMCRFEEHLKKCLGFDGLASQCTFSVY